MATNWGLLLGLIISVLACSIAVAFLVAYCYNRFIRPAEEVEELNEKHLSLPAQQQHPLFLTHQSLALLFSSTSLALSGPAVCLFPRGSRNSPSRNTWPQVPFLRTQLLRAWPHPHVHTTGLTLPGLPSTRGTSLALCTLAVAPGKSATSSCPLPTSRSTRGTVPACTLALPQATPDSAATEQLIMSRQAIAEHDQSHSLPFFTTELLILIHHIHESTNHPGAPTLVDTPTQHIPAILNWNNDQGIQLAAS